MTYDMIMHFYVQLCVFHNKWKLRSNKQIYLTRKCHQYTTTKIVIVIVTSNFIYHDVGKDAMVHCWDNDVKKYSNICICCKIINMEIDGMFLLFPFL